MMFLLVIVFSGGVVGGGGGLLVAECVLCSQLCTVSFCPLPHTAGIVLLAVLLLPPTD